MTAHALVQYGLLAFSSLFAIVNPVSAIPGFLAMTPQDTTHARLQMARTASIVCGCVLGAFAACGELIFKVLGITLPAFQIAGGLVLLLVSLDMLRAQRSPVQETAAETEEGMEKADIAITPLAIPMLSGPGAITTAIILEARASSWPEKVLFFAVVAVVAALCYLVLGAAARGANRISPIAMSIASRLMGLLLAATAVQFILTGLAPSFAH